MKKTYQIPSVIAMQLMPSTVVLAGSPGNLQNSGSGTDQIGDPIVIGG